MPLDGFRKNVISVISRNRDSKRPFADDTSAAAADTDRRQFNFAWPQRPRPDASLTQVHKGAAGSISRAISTLLPVLWKLRVSKNSGFRRQLFQAFQPPIEPRTF